MNTKNRPGRLLAILLSLCMVFTMMPISTVTAFAAENEEVISENTTWNARTISNDVRIADGVTVTVNGKITIDGSVTISGGTIKRGSQDAYFSIETGDSLTLNGITVNGDSIASRNSMFTVNSGTMDIKDSTVQNCVKNSSQGGAVNMSGGKITIESTAIQNCSATSYGGAIYITNGADATITSGIFSENKTTSTSLYGGGFIYNRGSTLTIEGGNFQSNSSAGRGGAVYNTAIADTKTYIRDGIFEGNISSYSNYEGSGAVFYSSEYKNETVLYISGSVRFGSDTANNGTDGVYLDSYSSDSMLRKMLISSTLQHSVHIYVRCSEKRAIAEGVEGYQLTAADMTKIQFHDVDSSGTNWYAWLDSEKNEVYVSETEPIYVIYDVNGATGSVTDNTIYSTTNNTVTVKSGEGLTYENYTFKGWNTQADGTGTTYQPGATFNITETTTLYAQWEPVAIEAYDVWVGGVQVTERNASDVLGNADGDSATVTYDSETKTLTLDGANITSGYETNVNGNSPRACGIYAGFDDKSGLAVRLAGENTINIMDTKTDSIGIALNSDAGVLNVTGEENAKLTVNTTLQCLYAYDGMSINGGIYDLKSDNGEKYSGEAICTFGPLTIDRADLTAVGAKNRGIFMGNGNGEKIIIQKSTLNIIGGSTSVGCEGVFSSGGIEIINSAVTATGDANGIAASNGEIVISGAETVVTAKSNRVDSNDPEENAAILGGGDTWDPKPITLNDGLAVIEPNGGTIGRYNNGREKYATLDTDGNYAAYTLIRVPAHSHNICGETDCDHSDGHTAAAYTALDSSISGKTLTGGNYYLTEDIENIDDSILITGTVNLCLNGHEISGNAANGIFRIGENGALSVCDCAGNGMITASTGHNPVFLHSGGTLNLYSGAIESNITAIVIDEDPSSGVTDSTGGTVNVYGGIVKSSGSRSQAIKINSGMTDAAVSIYDGKVSASYRGIWASSGEISISGGEINADSYALNIDNNAAKIYLSGSPVIAGGSADIYIMPTSNAENSVLVFHAKNDESSVYTGDILSLSLINTTADYYVAQGAAEGMLKKLLLTDNDYYLAYDNTKNAIQIKDKTYTVTLPDEAGYIVTAQAGSISPVKKGDSYSFTVTISDKYYKTDSFEVKANDVTLMPDNSGVYTIDNITANQTVTVTGVEKDTIAPAAEVKVDTNRWNTFLNNITFGLFFNETKTVTISATDNETGVEKTEYYISDTAYATTEELEKAVENSWESYSDSFIIEPNSKSIIYAKVTDNSDNVTYVSSNVIVLYTDAVQDTKEISFTKTDTTDVTANVILNSNTIDEIYCDDIKLIYGRDYSINGSTITFKADWLNTLAVDNYTLTVQYNPLGVEYVDNNGNDAPNTTNIALKVQKATGSVEIVNDISKVYNGSTVADVEYKTPSSGNVTVEYKVRDADDSTYTTTKPSSVDKYTVRVTVAADGSYTEASDTADFEIRYLSAPSDPFDLSGAIGQNGWYTSDVTITPPSGYTISNDLNGKYSDNIAVSASAEDVTIYMKNEQGQITDAISVGKIKIDKEDPSITVAGNTADYLTGDTVEITVSDFTSDVAKVEVKKGNGEFVNITSSYDEGYSITENGTYSFRVTDNAGRTAEKTLAYNRIDSAKPVLVISATHGGKSYTSGKWTNQDVTLTPENKTENLGTTNYQYRVDGGEWQDYTSSIVISDDTDADGVLYEFKAKSASGVVSEEVSITVKRDTAAPDGSIEIDENSVKAFINTVTFGLFYNKNVDVSIISEDAGSGIQSTWYHRSDNILTAEQVESIGDSDWTEYTGTIGLTAADTETFVYYVKIIDNAGNEYCFASNGAIFDLTAPVISGVTNQGEYYTTQTVQVTDDNLDTVTLNGRDVSSKITLAGNVDINTEYTIVATDKAGNITTAAVTMKPTADLSDTVDGIETGNVSSTDKETIEDYLDDLNIRLEDKNLTDAEKETIKDLIDEAQNLLDRIDEAEQAANTENIQQIVDITTDNVMLEDKETLGAAQNDIENAMEKYSDNYTEEEKAQLEEILQQIEDAIDVIQHVENAEYAIGGLPESVSPDDTNAEELINAAKQQYDALSEYEKSLISVGFTDKLEGLLAQLRDYCIIEGDGSIWAKGSGERMTFVANGAYSKFTGIEIDGTIINAHNYMAESGSTVIIMKPDYLNTLTTGQHTIAVLYTDGEAKGIFTVAETPDGDSISPGTGDDSHIIPWIIQMLICGCTVLTLSAIRRNKKHK